MDYIKATNKGDFILYEHGEADCRQPFGETDYRHLVKGNSAQARPPFISENMNVVLRVLGQTFGQFEDESLSTAN